MVATTPFTTASMEYGLLCEDDYELNCEMDPDFARKYEEAMLRLLPKTTPLSPPPSDDEISTMQITLPVRTRPSTGVNIAKLPYDLLYLICEQIIGQHSAPPSLINAGKIHNKFTNENETHLLLSSHNFPIIQKHLNGGPARRDLASLARTCNAVHGQVQTAASSIGKARARTHPLCIEQIWFEDMSWLLSGLDAYGSAAISTVKLGWDNRERVNKASMCAPSGHRKVEAAGNVFNALADKCIGVRTVHVRLCPEMLKRTWPDGRRRPQGEVKNFYWEIEGMEELKRMVKVITDERGGNVVLELGVDDFEGNKEQKRDLLTWLRN